ncbi:MAG: AAA family ATPase [Bdellovibrionota bacterium]
MHFKRRIFNELLRWKNNKFRLPLILKGARQVGKTVLIKEFGKEFKNIHEFNFQKDHILKTFFKTTNNPKKILETLEIYSEKKISLENDLIFFDEIQDCPEALNSLKFFAEDLPHSYIISAGSLLGIYLSDHSFPVGKVEFLHLYPMSFGEFLEACNKKALAEKLEILSLENNTFHDLFIEEMKKFFVLGGMPKVISTFIENDDYQKAREIQDDLLVSYKGDFAKYSGPVYALKILSVFENIPRQLAKDNRKFQFNLLQTGGRFGDFNSAIDWLVHAGLCYKIPIIEHAEIPLSIHVKENIFKLYFFDIGLLGALSNLPLSTFLLKNELFKTFKGAFTENFFLQEFTSQRNKRLYCWQGKNSEVDFLYNEELTLVPIEIKSGESGKLKSLGVFSSKYPCPWKIRCSLHSYEIQERSKLKTIPLYMAAQIERV